MNPGFFGIQYGEAIRPYRVNFRINPGASQYAGEALVIGCTDISGPTLVSRGSGAPTFNVPHYVLQLPYSAGRVGGAPTAVAPLCVQIPDGGITGGNARGAGAVDFQTTRTAANQVASGANSFAAGANNISSGLWSAVFGASNTSSAQASFAAGESCTAGGQDAIALGYFANASAAQSIAIGVQATASAVGSVAISSNGAALADATGAIAMGTRSSSRGILNRFVFSGSMRSANGDRHIPPGFPLCATTTNATATVLTTNAAAEATNNTFVVPNNHSCWVRGTVVARNSANNDTIAWTFTGLVSRDASAATVALLGSITPTTVGTADASMTGCVLAVGVNTTNGSLIVTATGIAATTIIWNGYMDIVENG